MSDSFRIGTHSPTIRPPGLERSTNKAEPWPDTEEWAEAAGLAM